MGVKPFQLAAILAGSGAGAAPLPTGYNIIIMAGQSNMVGAAAGNSSDLVVNPLVYQFGTSRGLGSYGTIVNVADPVFTPFSAGTNSGNTSTGSQFARAYASLTGKKVLLVPVAVANTDLTGTVKPWLYTAAPANPPATTGNVPNASLSNLYSNMIYEANRAVTAAVAADSGSAVVGMIWVQGENDANQAVDMPVYLAAWQAVIDGFRAQVTGASNAWVVSGSMVPEAIYEGPLVNATNGLFRTIAKAHKRAAVSRARACHVRGSYGYYDGLAAPLHYTNRLGLVDLGTRMAAAAVNVAPLKTLASTVVGAPGTPSIRSCVATSGQSIRIAVDRDWSATNTDLAIRYRVTGAGSWVTYYDGSKGIGAVGELFSIGGLSPSTAYDVQVQDINSAGASAWSATANATTTADATAQYDFETDTAGSGPAGVTSLGGHMQVVAAQTLSGGAVYGKSMALVGAANLTIWDAWLDKIPLGTDRTVVFRLGLATGAGIRLGVVLRAQPDSPIGLGTMQGYEFLIDYNATSTKVRIGTDTAVTDMGASAFTNVFGDMYWRCSVTGQGASTQVKLERSADGVTGWTTRHTLTDAAGTWAAGGVQFVVYNGSGTPSNMVIDSITWS